MGMVSTWFVPSHMKINQSSRIPPNWTILLYDVILRPCLLPYLPPSGVNGDIGIERSKRLELNHALHTIRKILLASVVQQASR